MTLQGKGFFIWQVRRCENGDAGAIANVAANAGLTHVLIKIADGASPYNVDLTSGQDLVLPVLRALRERGISAYGWHYVYGYDPVGEAEIAIQRVRELGVDGYVIDAEAQYKYPGRDEVARQFMSLLRQSLPVLPIALSSYRYPTYHPALPWQAFLEKCDLNMPQVYWQDAHNPAEQLIRSLREFEALTPFRPLIPTGSAYLAGDWQPTAAEMVEFLDTARNLNMTAANFWEWGHTRTYLPHLWDAITAYSWPVSTSDQDILIRFFQALNAYNLDALMDLYQDEAVHVTSAGALQGKTAIRAWYSNLLQKVLPNAVFVLGENNSSVGGRYFSWTASSPSGKILDGYDTFGLAGGKIVYHYSQFSVSA